MNKISIAFLSFAIAAFFLCACSDDSSSGSKVIDPDAGDSSSSEELSSGAVVDTVVEYVEPPTLSCELVEGLPFEFSPKPDTSYFIKSFGFYGDDLIAIPRHYNMRGFYGHEDDPAIDTFYVKKNGSSSWQKYAAFEHYLYKQEGNKLCIVSCYICIVQTA